MKKVYCDMCDMELTPANIAMSPVNINHRQQLKDGRYLNVEIAIKFMKSINDRKISNDDADICQHCIDDLVGKGINRNITELKEKAE